MRAFCVRGATLAGRDPPISPRGHIERLCLPVTDPSTLTSDWLTIDQKLLEADLSGPKRVCRIPRDILVKNRYDDSLAYHCLLSCRIHFIHFILACRGSRALIVFGRKANKVYPNVLAPSRF